MRILKFRVWDCKLKSFVKSLDRVFGLDWEGNLRCLNSVRECDEFIIQQFIGLLDKNGKEIYEGDILNASLYNFSKHGHFTPTYEVVFDYGKFRLKHIKSGETSLDFSLNGLVNTLKSEECLLVGNIFENKELLNEVKN